MAVVKIHGSREVCSKRNPIPKGVGSTCCIRQSAQILLGRIPAAVSVHFWEKIGQILNCHV